MINIKTFKKNALAKGAKIALKHRLYVSGWQLSGNLVKLVKNPEKYLCYEIAICFKDEIPVAICLYVKSTYTWSSGNLQCFCKKTERRNGYASKCINEIMKTKEDPCTAEYGIDGSRTFWSSNGIRVI